MHCTAPLCHISLLIQLVKHILYHLFDLRDNVINGNLLVDALCAGHDLAAALGKVSRADNDSDRAAEQVCVGEHNAGAHVSVVINNLDSVLLHLVIELVGKSLCVCVVRSQAAQMNLPRSYRYRPNGTVIIVANLAHGGRNSAYADTVAAHYRILLVAVLVEIGHMHRLCVFCAELEDIADLDAARYIYRVLAALRADSAVNYLCKIVILDLAHIARDVETGIVVVVLVSAASEIGGALERIVEENRYVLGQTDGAYEPPHPRGW